MGDTIISALDDYMGMSGEQEKNWDSAFMENESFFGESPSLFCVRSADAFKGQGLRIILELGAGQGRDTKYFIDNGLNVIATDFSDVSCAQLLQKFGDRITVVKRDLREGVDFPPDSIDGCYAHMLLTMDFTDDELRRLIDSVKKALVPGGLFIFSVRNTNDHDFETGQMVRQDVWKNQKGFNVRYYTNDGIRKFCEGFEIVRMNEFSEGNKVLYGITLRKLKDQ